MGLLNLFRRSRKTLAAPPPPPVTRDSPAPVDGDPDGPAPAPALSQLPTVAELRVMLFDAIATGDEEKLARLCRDHHDFLLEHANTWSIVPAAFLANPEAARWYGDGFHVIARFCHEKLDRRELLTHLQDGRDRGDTPANAGVVDVDAA